MSPSLLLPLFFQYPLLLTLVLLLINHHEEKEERCGRDVLDSTCRLIRGAAPTICGRVPAEGLGAPARLGARGPRQLVTSAGRPLYGTRSGGCAGLRCRVADGRGGRAAGIRPCSSVMVATITESDNAGRTTCRSTPILLPHPSRPASRMAAPTC